MMDRNCAEHGPYYAWCPGCDKARRVERTGWPDHPSAGMPISSLEISDRVRGLIWGMRLELLGDLAIFEEAELRRQPMLGQKAFNEIKGALAKHGLTLGMVSPEVRDAKAIAAETARQADISRLVARKGQLLRELASVNQRLADLETPPE